MLKGRIRKEIINRDKLPSNHQKEILPIHTNAWVLLCSDTDNTGNLAGKLEKRGFQSLPVTSREDTLRIVTGRFLDVDIVDSERTPESNKFRQDLRDLAPEGSMPTIVISTANKTTPDDDSLQIEFCPRHFGMLNCFPAWIPWPGWSPCKAN